MPHRHEVGLAGLVLLLEQGDRIGAIDGRVPSFMAQTWCPLARGLPRFVPVFERWVLNLACRHGATFLCADRTLSWSIVAPPGQLHLIRCGRRSPAASRSPDDARHYLSRLDCRAIHTGKHSRVPVSGIEVLLVILAVYALLARRLDGLADYAPMVFVATGMALGPDGAGLLSSRSTAKWC